MTREDPASPETAIAPILSAGFRPFFLFAGLYGTFPLVVWIAVYLGEATLPGPMSPLAWHGHEMVFGFGAAGMAGFLLTAVPSWTSSPPVKGWPLALLALLWLVGRVAMWIGWGLGNWAVAIADISLLLALSAVLGAKIIACGQVRNFPLISLVVILLVANVLMHMEVLEMAEGTAAIGLRLGVFVFCLLVALIGGRVIPAFTSNVLRMRQDPVEAASRPLIEKLNILGLLLAIILDLASPDAGPWRAIAGSMALLAGVLLFIRMRHWRLIKVLN